MKQLKNDLQAISKTLNELTRKTEQMAKRLEKLEKADVAKTPKPGAKGAGKKVVKKPAKAGAKAAGNKVVKKPAKATAIDTIFSIIKKSRKGVDAATLRKETGFDNKKVWNHINILKMKGKIRSVERGVYVKI
jgi:hypothetical protein